MSRFLDLFADWKDFYVDYYWKYRLSIADGKISFRIKLMILNGIDSLLGQIWLWGYYRWDSNNPNYHWEWVKKAYAVSGEKTEVPDWMVAEYHRLAQYYPRPCDAYWYWDLYGRTLNLKSKIN